jgi:hypothetical protein
MRRVRRKIHLRGSGSPLPALGEDAGDRTEALLRRLPEREWSVLPAGDSERGIDHVLVGPGGVFAIASHRPPGATGRVRDGVLWLRRDRDTRADRPEIAINRHVLDGARAVQREIRSRTGRGPEVHAVVVLWCEFPQRVAESSRMAFVHGRDLPGWVTHRAMELDEPGRAEIVRALRSAESAPRGVRHLPHPHIPRASRTRRAA